MKILKFADAIEKKIIHQQGLESGRYNACEKITVRNNIRKSSRNNIRKTIHEIIIKKQIKKQNILKNN